jgi:thioredoxin 1
MTTLTAADGPRIARAFTDPGQLVVVSLCAAWCDTCNVFRAGFEELAAGRPGVAFVWLDIEDDAMLAGEIDVENFPTLAIYRGSTPLHFGVSLPHATTVGRLLDALASRDAPLRDAPEAVRELPDRFSRHAGA